MGLGPVLRYELIATSRRGRYYAARIAVRALLALRRLERAGIRSTRGGIEVDPAHGAAGGVRLPGDGVGVQWRAILLVIIPAMTAGVIADAYRRKTLRDLLASGLSARAIVVGKLGARLVHVAVFVTIGLPVVSLPGVDRRARPLVGVLRLHGHGLARPGGRVGCRFSPRRSRGGPARRSCSPTRSKVAWLILPTMIGTDHSLPGLAV